MTSTFRSRTFSLLLSVALAVSIGAGAWTLAPKPADAQDGGWFTALAYSAGCEHQPQRLGLALEQARSEQAALTSLKRFLSPVQSAQSLQEACRIIAQVSKHNLITTAFKNLLRDCLNANASSACTTVALYKFHGLGTSSTAATVTDTGCTTELTTQYAVDSTRPTGSQTTNGNGVYRTVGTNTVDATVAATEWCLNSAATSTGNLASHVIFSTINLSSGDSLQTTWDLTLS